MLIIVTLLLFAALPLAISGPIVTLPSGMQLEGTHGEEADMWRGIRYAQAPIGNLRWRPPLAYEPTTEDMSGPVDATSLRSVCNQKKSMCTRQGCSEDCLYLNVFTAKNSTVETAASGDLLPVALFVHGGSYKSGSSNLYPAGELAKYWDGKAIVVTINYRLNVFGFLGAESLRSLDTNDGSTGNQGIQDQRLAMQWVRDNIKAFGGDASKVMIFGESAGAGSMSMHLTMKKSYGLYRRVILESGSFTQWSMQSMQHAQSSFDAFLAQTTCGDSDDDDMKVACLQALSTEAVNTAMAAMDMPSVPENDPYFPFSPTADGVEATTAAWIAAANGDVNDVPILHGYNRDEGAIFLPDLDRNATHEQLHAFWRASGLNSEQIATLDGLYVNGKSYPYVEDTSDSFWAAERSLGDVALSCSANYVSEKLHTTQRVYHYYFTHVSKYASKHEDDVTHASELPYVLHFNSLFPLSRADRTMSDVMASYWGNFLISEDGDPNEKHVGLDDLPEWPVYSAQAPQLLSMQLDERDDVQPVQALKEGECGFWIPFLDAAIRADFE